jgi:hypothetical protein
MLLMYPFVTDIMHLLEKGESPGPPSFHHGQIVINPTDRAYTEDFGYDMWLRTTKNTDDLPEVYLACFN